MAPEPEDAVDEFSQAVRAAIAPIERGIRATAGDVEWATSERGDEYFDAVMHGTRGVDSFVVHLKILVRFDLEAAEGVARYARELVALEPGGLHRPHHSYLVIAREIDDLPRVQLALEEANRELWNGIGGRKPRAFLAFASLDDERPRAPAADQPRPRLTDVDLLRILVDSTVVGGRATTAPPAPRADDAGEELPEFTPAERAGIDVLVVDDDPLVREMVSDTLGLAGYPVRLAEDWVSFRRELFAATPGVVLLDVNLPGLSGDRVALAAGMVRPPKPRVILHSGIEPGELRRMARRVGALNYLPKGGDIDELIRVVDSAAADWRAG